MKSIIPVVAIALVVSPLVVAAQGGEAGSSRNGGTASSQQRSVEQFCANLETRQADMMTRIQTRAGEVSARHEGNAGERQSKRAERQSELATKRAEMDAKRDAHYEKLSEAATTEAQLAAVEEFSETVEALVDTRRTAIDAAIEDFEDTVEALRESQAAVVADLTEATESGVEAAFAEAEAACETDDATFADVSSVLRDALASQRQAQQANREQYSFKDDLEAARAARKAAVQAAVTEFQAGMDAAKAELRSAFGAE